MKRSQAIIYIVILVSIAIGCSLMNDLSGFSFTPEPGTYESRVTVEVTYDKSFYTDIYYTIDGSEPDNSSLLYNPTNKIEIKKDTTLKVVAYKYDEILASTSVDYKIENASELTLAIEGEYTNSTGSNPIFVIDPDSLPEEINLVSSNIATSLNSYSNSVEIALNNINIMSDKTNYEIDSVVVEEYRNGEWRTDSEFSSGISFLTELAIVLVLDRSSSLGTEFNNVKGFAKNFIDVVKRDSSNSRIGIVDFATNIGSYSLTTNQDALKGYIDSMSMETNTKYYDAIAQGVDMLETVLSDVEGAAIVSFTDGLDNYSDTTVQALVEKLESSQIKSFTIGLEGKDDLDETILESLAVDGQFAIANEISELGQIFGSFSKAVSNVYKITYTRNDQIINEPRKIKFTINAISKT